MKLRQIDNKDQPVKREDLKPGDKVESMGYAYFVCPSHFKHFAVNLSGDGWASLSCDYHLIYRIRITGEKDGQITWERICKKEPKAVKWGELKPGDYFDDQDDGESELFRRIRHGGKAVDLAYRVSSGQAFTHAAFYGDTLYRAEVCGFDDETGEWLWRHC